MSIGIGIGIGLRGARSRVLRSADFTAATRSGGLYTLPSWLAITCSTTGRTVQESAATVRTGLGANAARARSVDGSTFGLSVEGSSVNLTHWSAALASWANAGAVVTANALLSPDGTDLADNIAYGAGVEWIGVLAGLAASTAGTLSLWGKRGTLGTQLQVFDGTAAAFTAVLTMATTWSRQELVIGSVHASDVTSGLGNIGGVAAGNAYVWGVQLEARRYPTSWVPTPGAATASRAADVLSIPDPTVVAPHGFFDVRLMVAPNYSQAEQDADHNLLYFGANDRLFLKASDHKVYLRIGGADVASSALTWSREQALTIRAAHRASGRSLTVSGATTGNGTATAAAAGALALPATGYILGSNTGAEECADLRGVAFSA